LRLSKKIIDTVVRDVAGEDVLPLTKLLRSKKNVSELKLADSIKIEVNEARNMLYRLYHANLVSFKRRKDKSNGWYTYYWSFKDNHLKFLAKSHFKDKLSRLKERLGREQDSMFFLCLGKCIRLDFETASKFDFKCPECGLIMDSEDNAHTIVDLKKQIKEFEKIV